LADVPDILSPLSRALPYLYPFELCFLLLLCATHFCLLC